MRAPAFWADPEPGVAAGLLWPVAALYGVIAARRMNSRGARGAAPVICIGNFVLGGAGKTPAALAVGRMLSEMGERVAFVSRGYGGARQDGVVAVDSALHDAALVGDEPLLLARASPCFVSRNRPLAAAAAIAAGASVVVLDDGMQNPSIAKDFVLALVDAEAGLGNGFCFPAGPLRAPLPAQLSHVDAIVCIGEGLPCEKLGDRPLLKGRLEPDPAAAHAMTGRDVLAFAGIGRPTKFFDSLRRIGARVVLTREFSDHHRFSQREFEALRREAQAKNLLLATTEKDAMRLSPEQRGAVSVLPVTLVIENEAELRGMLRKALARRRSEIARG